VCCDPATAGPLPPAVAAMLADYRARLATHPDDWGEEASPGMARAVPYARWLGGRLLAAAFSGGEDDWPATVRACLGDPLPTGVVVATLDGAGVGLRAGPAPYLVAGRQAEVAILLDSRRDEPAVVEVDGGPVRVPAGGVELAVRSLAGARDLTVGTATIPAGRPAAGARLRLRAGAASRWSVVDDHGGAWFPPGKLPKWDLHGRPLFHGDDLELEVPAVPLTVSCTRGMEFDVAQAAVTPEAGTTAEVELAPRRRYDPVAGGWYGGDLHVHMNYSGDLVCGPEDAACMQAGEGLHLMNLVAANAQHTLVYDREAFEATAGRDLPWTTGQRVARFGIEYRNDLLGHFHALGPTGPPGRYHSGHEGSDEPFDWPANDTACAELRGLGATVGYTHPVFSSLADGSPADAFRYPRSVEARELVADAALGLVDSVDLLGVNDADGASVLYHHLLNCGLRLAATAGTDVWLSYSRGPQISNPPGWARVYADLRGASLSVAAFQDAVRAGRTLASNGPWVELAVGGHGPGDRVALAPGTTVAVSARAVGAEAARLELVGPDGVVAAVDAGGGAAPAIDTEVEVDGSTWLCAVARGPGHPSVLGPAAFAHTSPVHLEVAGRPLRRPASARWLLDWLDRFEELVRGHGRFADDGQRDQVVAVIDRSRRFYRSLL
jgi:hypothetical protein